MPILMHERRLSSKDREPKNLVKLTKCLCYAVQNPLPTSEGIVLHDKTKGLKIVKINHPDFVQVLVLNSLTIYKHP